MGQASAGRGKRFEKRHELVERVLRANIADGHLSRGIVLLEQPLAVLLQTSRAPSKRPCRRSKPKGWCIDLPAAACWSAPRIRT